MPRFSFGPRDLYEHPFWKPPPLSEFMDGRGEESGIWLGVKAF